MPSYPLDNSMWSGIKRKFVDRHFENTASEGRTWNVGNYYIGTFVWNFWNFVSGLAESTGQESVTPVQVLRTCKLNFKVTFLVQITLWFCFSIIMESTVMRWNEIPYVKNYCLLVKSYCLADSFEKPLMLGKNESGRRRGRQRMRWLDGITDSWTWVWVNSGSWWRTGRPGELQSMGSQRVGQDWAT